MLEGKDWQLPSEAFFLCTVWVNSLLNWGSRHDGGAQSCFGQPEDARTSTEMLLENSVNNAEVVRSQFGPLIYELDWIILV